MKKLLLFVCLILGITVFAQKNKQIPEAAKNAFAKSFTGATNVKWDKENADFEVDFKLDGKEMSALYDVKGNLKETEEAVSKDKLPAAALTYFNQQYKNVAIKETAKITKANKTIVYEIGVKGKDILFDANGKFIEEAKD
jgi:hypothetical protein